MTVDASAGFSISSSQSDIEFDAEVLRFSDVVLPPESLAPADGVEVTVHGTLTTPAELRLTLAGAPSDDAMPMAWHVADDGSVEMVTGIWDEGSNEIVITTKEFSGWIPDWLDPVPWVAGVIDLVADTVTGRTDPPACGEPGPEWAQFVPPVGTGIVHSCLQSNAEPDSGEVRAEVFFKSNRRGFQAVTVPAGAAYAWVEGQPDWIRPSLAWLATWSNTGTVTNILLPGGMSTSLGFNQPELTTEAGIAIYATPGTIVMDGVMAALGLLAGTDASDLVTVAVAVNSCALNIYGVDMLQGDTTVGLDLDTVVTSLLACSLDTLPGLADPDRASAAITTLDDAHLLGSEPAGGRGAQIGTLIDSANALGSIAERAANAVAIASVGVDLWDKVLDNTIGNQPAHLIMRGHDNTAAQEQESFVVLGPDGLGPIDFGSAGDLAIAYVSGFSGSPDSVVVREYVPLNNPWGDVRFGDDADRPYMSFASAFSREVCWREFCVILGSDTGQEWTFVGWDYYLSDEDLNESNARLQARTPDGISPRSTIGELVDRHPGIEFISVETEVVEFTLPGWEGASGTIAAGLLPEEDDAGRIPLEFFDLSQPLQHLMSGAQLIENIG